MKIGIGITTRRRPEVLKTALECFSVFPTPNSKLVVVEDDPESDQTVEFLVSDFQKLNKNVEVVFRKAKTRLGIAKAKNACLAVLTDCDHVFLFDDDTWPKAPNWAEKWIEINDKNKTAHSIWNVEILKSHGAAITIEHAHRNIGSVAEPSDEMVAWTNCLGVMLYFTRSGLDKLGGYDGSAKNVYGYEHAQMSSRAHKARLTQGHLYISPLISGDLIYSFDASFGRRGEEPPIPITWRHSFISSVTPEEASGYVNNTSLMSTKDIYIPLVDPLA